MSVINTFEYGREHKQQATAERMSVNAAWQAVLYCSTTFQYTSGQLHLRIDMGLNAHVSL